MSQATDAPLVEELHDRLINRRSEYIDLLDELVMIDSCWANPDGVREVGRIIADRLEESGFEISVEPQPTLPIEDKWLHELLAPGVHTTDLAPTIVARRRGTAKASILLLGDLDTAYPGGSEGVPFKIVDDRAFGTGIADMKGGLVTLIASIEALVAAEVLLPALTVILAGDEQCGSLGSRHTIKTWASVADWALCLECARQGGNVMAARGHIGVGLLEVLGSEAHAGTDIEKGISAIEGLAQILPPILALTAPQKGILVTPTMINGGSRRSVVPGKVAVVLDLRATDLARWQDLTKALETVVHSFDGPAKLLLRYASHRPGFARTPEVDVIIEIIQRVGRAISDVPGAVTSMAAGSSAFAAEAGCVVLDGLGPPGGSLMTPDEHISITGMISRATILACTLNDLASAHRPHFRERGIGD